MTSMSTQLRQTWRDFIKMNKVVRAALMISLLLVLVIELGLKNITSNYCIQFYQAGEVFLKLCYSITASSIFYFINQTIPKEQKKRKVEKILSSKFDRIMLLTQSLKNTIGVPVAEQKQDITREKLETYLENIKYSDAVETKIVSSVIFNDWADYLIFISDSLMKNIQDLLTLHEFLNPNQIEALGEFCTPLMVIGMPSLKNFNERNLKAFAYFFKQIFAAQLKLSE